MKKALRILAVVTLLAALGLWAAKGANRGWTINNIEHDTLDPVTRSFRRDLRKGVYSRMGLSGRRGVDGGCHGRRFVPVPKQES